MFKNYIKIALRNIKKEKFYSLLNIAGLCIGIAATLLIYLYVNSELSYDKFHKDIDKMYLVKLQGKIGDQEIDVAVTCPPMANALVTEFPEVEAATRLQIINEEVVRIEDVVFTEDNVFMADSNFFDFFSFKLLEGNPKTALTEPHTLVLSESMAKKYFGEESPIDKLMTLGRFNSTYKVTGVVEDTPENSHFTYNILLSASSSQHLKSTAWLSNNIYTYFKINEGADINRVQERFKDLVIKYVGPEVQQFMGVSLEQMEASGGAYGFIAFPVKDIHLESKSSAHVEPGGSITYVYIFIAIAALIILIACINFMNLATARSAGRAKEVGLRKTFGSSRSTLIKQFLSESFIFSLIATILSLGIVILLLPQFNLISGKNLSIESLFQPDFIFISLGVLILIGFLAGSYPAFYLTSFQPAEVLKGKVKEGMKSGFIRNALVVVQFFISTFLIICTVVVYSQLQFFHNTNIGMDKENIIVVSNAERLQTNKTAFKESLSSLNGITSVSFTNNSFPGVNNTTVFKNPHTSEDHIVGTYYADHEHIDVMNFTLVEGRYFSKDFPSDSTAVVVNEAAVKEFGYSEPLKEKVQTMDRSPSIDNPVKTDLRIVGVVKDFNFEGLHRKVRPMVIQLGDWGSKAMIKYSGDPKEAVGKVEEMWKKNAANEPFEYQFMDENFDALFRAEERMGQVFTIFTGLAIIIACLGLVGLSAFTAQKRIKEIGVRKVMGASETSLVMLLNKEFTRLVLVAFVIAAPLAYYTMDNWLNNFAYRINIGWIVFAIAAFVTLAVAWLTVSFQSLKAAKSNPVNSLRSE